MHRHSTFGMVYGVSAISAGIPASIAQAMSCKLHPLWKWLLAYLLTDEAYAVTILYYQEPGDDRQKHWYFLGAGLALWTAWQLSTAAGIFLGGHIPASWSLDFASPLTDQLPTIWPGRTALEKRLLAQACELCGSQERVTVHHIRALKENASRRTGDKEAERTFT